MRLAPFSLPAMTFFASGRTVADARLYRVHLSGYLAILVICTESAFSGSDSLFVVFGSLKWASNSLGSSLGAKVGSGRAVNETMPRANSTSATVTQARQLA